MDKDLAELGMKQRRATLGDAYVDRAMNNVDDFNRGFQDLLNTYCWGAVWGDETLDLKTRSMINLGLIAGVNRMEEWELHLRGAINNGVSKDEVRAILHQIAVYAGMPAGVECFRIARRVFSEIEGKP
ncbi:MAG: carboxymuconolactone decarboxylase family protein [Hyphomicrobiaceae bacterium]